MAREADPRRTKGGIDVAQIRPVDEVTGAWPDCTRCSWVAVGHGVMRLKYVSRSCPEHGKIECE